MQIPSHVIMSNYPLYLCSAICGAARLITLPVPHGRPLFSDVKTKLTPRQPVATKSLCHHSYNNNNQNNPNLSTRYNVLSSYRINAPEPSTRHHSNNLQPKGHLHCPHGFNYAIPQVSRCHRHSKQRCAITLGIRISTTAAPVPRGIQKPPCTLEPKRHNFSLPLIP